MSALGIVGIVAISVVFLAAVSAFWTAAGLWIRSVRAYYAMDAFRPDRRDVVEAERDLGVSVPPRSTPFAELVKSIRANAGAAV